MNVNGLRPSERKILEVLVDGAFHPCIELAALLDELAENAHVRPHVSNLRCKLPQGYVIVGMNKDGVFGYQIARTIQNNNSGRI